VPLSTFLVEDNAHIRHNLIAAMEDEVDIHLIGTATTEEDAVAWLGDNPGAWDLLVVDLFLHEGSGLGIVKRCSRSRPGQRVVVLTNYATGEIADWARELGADAVFDKAADLDGFFSLCASFEAEGRESGGKPMESLAP
jgi:ActR/RegA family two-component response regulator